MLRILPKMQPLKNTVIYTALNPFENSSRNILLGADAAAE